MKNLSIKEYIQNRLNQFGNQGIETHLDYQAQINDFSDIGFCLNDFNRILFSLCKFSSLKKEIINICTTSCSQFFILSLDCIESDLPPGQEGTTLPTGFMSHAYSILEPFKDQLTFGLDYFGNQQLTLRIPLNSNEDQRSPLMRAFFMPYSISLPLCSS